MVQTSSATATNSGAISIANLAGTLNVNGPIITDSGAISLGSADDLQVDAAIGANTFSGTISLVANTDGAGTQGFLQTLNGSLTTANTNLNAASITVGGSGDITLGVGSIGGASGGGLTVTANGGNILWNSGFTLGAGAPDGGGNSNVLKAHDYTFTTSGSGSIGTAALPIQTDNYATGDNLAGGNTLYLTGGSGGVYLWDWGGTDLSLTQATATGAGNIQVVTANAGGHNLFVTGNVSAESGNIQLWSNDNITVGPGVVIGGAGFSGTVMLSANRDKATAGQTLSMDATSSILTSNTTSNAALINLYGDPGTPSIITLANVAVGNGGTITVDDSPEAEAGIIVALPGTKLDAGLTGTILLNTAYTTGSGDAVGTSATPLDVVAGNVGFLTVNGNIWINDDNAANVAGNNAGTGGSTNITTLAGTLTVASPQLTDDGGAINLTGAAGVVVSSLLGDSNTGAINIDGPLTGTGTIVLGSGDLTVTQSTDSSFGGTVSGTKNFVKQGNGTLTLSNSSPLAGSLVVSNGTLSVTGALPGLAGANVASAGTLAGTGTVNGSISDAGTLSPGTGGAGITERRLDQLYHQRHCGDRLARDQRRRG